MEYLKITDVGMAIRMVALGSRIIKTELYQMTFTGACKQRADRRVENKRSVDHTVIQHSKDDSSSVLNNGPTRFHLR